MPAAFAHSQLKRLDDYIANAQRNGRYLTEVLNNMEGISPAYILADRTTNYHKFRVVLNPKVLGVDGDPKIFRDQVFAALKAEGVSVAIWQTFPLLANPLFQIDKGYGKNVHLLVHIMAKKLTTTMMNARQRGIYLRVFKN